MKHGPLDWEQIQREHGDAHGRDVDYEREEEEPQEIYVGGLPLPPEARSSSVKRLDDIVRAAQLRMEEERSLEPKSLESLESFETFHDEENKDWQIGKQVGLVPSIIVPSMTDTLRPGISYGGVKDRLEVDRHNPYDVVSKAPRAATLAGKPTIPKDGYTAPVRRHGLHLTPATARQAIVLMEVLGPPKAMQQ